MKILYVTTVSSTMNAFFKTHIEMLVREGHEVNLACNDTDSPIDVFYKTLGCRYYHVDFSRSPLSKDNFKAYGQLKKVIQNGCYDIVHCHTPNASVMSRLVCRKLRKKTGLKVFYTAHGFHFYKGAPLKNWLLYYPVERICSRMTDLLVTINREDYTLATKRMRAGRVEYVPGVGIDTERFAATEVDVSAKRRELGVPEDAFLLLSVGELNENKNHQIVLRALAAEEFSSVHYAIAGKGHMADPLLALARELGVSQRFHLLGYRTDVAELYKTADLYALPSIREGLNVSVMEALAAGCPVACSRIRGNVDMICAPELGSLFDPTDAESVRSALRPYVSEQADPALSERMNYARDQFDSASIHERMRSIYLQAVSS